MHQWERSTNENVFSESMRGRVFLSEPIRGLCLHPRGFIEPGCAYTPGVLKNNGVMLTKQTDPRNAGTGIILVTCKTIQEITKLITSYSIL